MLYDALLEAGCDSEEILHYCKEATEIIKGHWIFDLLLDRK